MTRFALCSFRSLLVLGLVFLLGAWVVGPSSSATKVRVWWDQLLGRAGEAAADVGGLTSACALESVVADDPDETFR